ncbi:MAG: DUF429 domain-containing protein [Actinomycetota bacterium]
MITLGIDLAAQAKNTAACLLDWTSAPVRAIELQAGLDDDQLMAFIAQAEKVGIDSPFGWPTEFVAAVSGYLTGNRWPETTPETLHYRLTDRIVTKLARRPLSVSTDRIGITAMRCARLLGRAEEFIGPVDRSGTGRLCEVYPAAALVLWGFDVRGYKNPRGSVVRARLIERFLAGATWMVLEEELLEICVRSDHCFDALVAATIARAAALELTQRPSGHEREIARQEGWIHLPSSDSLGRLGPLETGC